MNPPYQNEQTRLLDRSVIDANAAQAVAQKWLNDFVSAKAAAFAASSVFVATLTEDAARDFHLETNRVRSLQMLAGAIEDEGGVEYVRRRALHTNANFQLLETGLRKRSEQLLESAKPLRTALAAKRAALTEKGIHFMLVENDAEVARLRGTVEQIDSAIRDADVKSGQCKRWDDATVRAEFDVMFRALTCPLPTV